MEECDHLYQARKNLPRSQLKEATHLTVGQLEAKIHGQLEKDIRVRLQGGQETRRRPVGHELRDIRQHFAIRRLAASTMRCAEEDQTQCRIPDGLISWIQPCLKQSLKDLSAVK
jgi:hypothetical protein